MYEEDYDEYIQERIDCLVNIGESYGCELLLPPFEGNLKNPFFYISEIKKDDKACISFIGEIIANGFEFWYTDTEYGKKEYIRINI